MKRKNYRIAALLVVMLLGIGAMAGMVLAKYVYSTEVSGTIKFSAKLADSIVLQEHRAVKQQDGSYSLTEEIGTENTYTLIPGLDIPKDPYILISGKTPLPSYLYVEVVDEKKNEALSYAISDQWMLITSEGGEHGGDVYVYTTGSGLAAPLVADPAGPIYILQNNQVTVSQTLKQSFEEGKLQFYACMGEIPEEGNSSVLDIYKDAYSSN